MIQKLVLKNFLSIREARIEFDPGINVLVGESFSGKSNILRAIEELLIEPGTDIVRAGSSEARLAIQLEKFKIKRIKSSKKNSYSLNNVEFSSVGRTIPEEIAHRINLVWLDKTCISISPQTGPRFLLDDTPSTAAKALAQISGLDKLLRAIELADKEGRGLKQKAKFLKEEIKKYEELSTKANKILKFKGKIKRTKELSKLLEELEGELNIMLVKKEKRKKIQSDLKLTDKQLKKTETSLNKSIKESNICPLSGGEFFESCRERIVKE